MLKLLPASKQLRTLVINSYTLQLLIAGKFTGSFLMKLTYISNCSYKTCEMMPFNALV